MKKLLLLLALSFFSIQSFAAGCPDGSEPVRSISADGTYFVFECNNSSSESTAVGNQEYFEIINQTSNDDKYYMELLNFSASKIKNIPADQKTLAVFIPIGAYIRTIEKDAKNYGRNSYLYEVLLTQTQMDNVFKKMDDFYANLGCANDYDEGIEGDKYLIKNGIETYHQPSLCGNKNLIIMIFNEFRKPSHALLKIIGYHTLSHITLHEAYHSFQNINSCNSWDMPPYEFLTEGGAEYFSTYYMLERENRLDELNNHMLEEVMRRDAEDPSTLVHEGEPHMKGLAAINLMIQQGWVEQSSILDGSFFSDCSGVRQLLLGSDKLKYLNDNWFKIELHNGNLRFNPLLSDDEVRVQNSFIKDLAIASSKKIPENAYSTGSFSSGVWDCKVGYEKHNNGCRKKSDPENSYSLSEDIPLNSHKSGGGWECNTGYTQYGSKCVAKSTNQETKVIPESTQNESSDYLEEIKTSEKSKSVSQSEEYPTVSIEESYEDILLNSARIDAKQKISGFTFTQANYHKMVKKDGVLVKSAPETEITGWYQFIPKENDWHTGIIFFEKGQLKWKNEAGVEWNLQPDINNNKLITGEDNPYQTKYEPDFMLIKSSEKSTSVSQSEEYPTVDYNTNLLELCKRDVEGLWTNKIKEDSFLFVVASKNGNCEYGLGNTKYNAFENCTKNQEDNNIVGICELYGEAGEVVWDGHLKPENSNSSSSKKLPDNSKFSRNRYGFKCNSGFKREGNNMCTKDLAIAQKIAEAIKTSEKSKSTSKEVSTLETNESVDYVERLKQVKALLDSGIINQDDFEKMKQKIIDTMN